MQTLYVLIGDKRIPFEIPTEEDEESPDLDGYLFIIEDEFGRPVVSIDFRRQGDCVEASLGSWPDSNNGEWIDQEYCAVIPVPHADWGLWEGDHSSRLVGAFRRGDKIERFLSDLPEIDPQPGTVTKVEGLMVQAEGDGWECWVNTADPDALMQFRKVKDTEVVA